MRFLKVNYKDKIFVFLFLLTLFIAILLRTYNYYERISIASDNSRDVQVATYAADNHKFPLTGNFASSGPFFYGPWWYYFLKAVSVFPLGALTYWYVATGLSILFIALISKVGQEIEDKLLGFIVAFYAAISPAQIQNSFSVWNPSITPLLVLVSLFFAIRSLKKLTLYNMFFLGLFTSLAFTIHFQNMLILPIPFVTIIILLFKTQNKKGLFPYISFLALGSFMPLIPLLYFDVSHYWFNSRNFLIYLLVDQYKIWVPNRWLTYAGIYWPQTVSYIIGGSVLISYLIIFLIGALTFFNIKNLREKSAYFLIAITFLLELILFRYYRGERFFYLSLFSHPSILIMTAWITYKIIRVNRIVGLSFLALITIFTINRAFSDVHAQVITLAEIQTAKKEILKTFPNSSFNIWRCASNGTRVGHPLAYFIYKEGKEDLNGVNIGVCETFEKTVEWTLISERDLQQKYGEGLFYQNMATSKVYEDIVEWWQKSPPPKSEGNVWEFIKKNAF